MTLILWACGIVDEIEVNDPERDVYIYGPFERKEDAETYTQTLSLDPNEADVFQLRPPAQ